MTESPPRTIVLGVTVDQSLKLMRGHPAHLDETGWEVHVVSSGDSGHALKFYLGAQPRTVRLHQIPTAREPSPLRDLVSLWGWITMLRRTRPDVVLLGTPKASLLGLTAARLLRVRTRIYLIRGFRFEGATGLRRRVFASIERWAASMATHVVAVSPSLRDLAVDSGVGRRAGVDVLGAGSSNGVVVPSSERRRELAEARAATLADLGLAADVPVIGYVGRITSAKGVQTLAEASAALMRSSVDHQLLLLGDEDEPGHLAQVTKVLDEASVRYTSVGYLADPLVVMAALDVFCLPSLREGMPNVALEAASLGVPVVTTDATGCRDAVIPGETGVVVRAGDARDLEHALAWLLADPARRTAMGAAGRRWVAEAFDRSRVWGRWDDYLSSAASEPRVR